MKLEQLEKIIHYTFKNQDLLREGLTHRSYINENKKWKHAHNERLEFLGDAVLELVVTEELYYRFPQFPEGKLTELRAALVNYLALVETANEIDLEKYIYMSRGEKRDVGRARESILANATEAVIGAIYLDSSYVQAKAFINTFVMNRLDNITKKGSYRDPKSLLQEKIQATLKITPEYHSLKESGPEHDKKFQVGVFYGKKLIATGEGFSKQTAESEAAAKALEME